MLEILGKTSIDFMGLRRYSFAFSGVLIFVGLSGLIQVWLGVATHWIDFSGGTAVQLKFDQPIPIEQARQALGHHGFAEVEIQDITQGNKLLIRVKAQTTIEEKVAEKVLEIFKKDFPSNPFVIDSSYEIGPTIGQKLQKDALIAISISMLGIIVYVAARFEFRFGTASAIATFHVVLAVLGVYYVLEKEITLLIVTALLTLAGYSLTDTVVVFDRIRENLKVRHRDPLATTINNAINQVLSRTIIVSLTVILVLIPLTLFGGEVLHDFSPALLLGVIIGTYSSIFVASPLLIVWKGTPGKLLRRS